MFSTILSWFSPKKNILALPEEVAKNYKLYHFDPNTVAVDGYVYIDSFATQQECDESAFSLGYTHYRIEIAQPWGSMTVFETPLSDNN
jgi:hypothetical protein